MDETWLSDYKQEIKRCKKIYPNFEDGAAFVGAVFDAIKTGLENIDEQSFQANQAELLPLETEKLMNSNTTLDLPLPLDKALFSSLFNKVLKGIVKTNPALKNNMSRAAKLLESHFAKDEETLYPADLADFKKVLIEEEVMAEDLATLLFTVIMSSVYKWQLLPLKKVLRTDLYEGGECPVCGKMPHFGLLHPGNNAKHLECWQCGTRWVHPRVKCPYCNNEDREKLGYFTLEGSDVCRVNYCQACHCYCKVYDVRAFHAGEEVVLTVHNLASLDYDLLARKEGFLPGSGLKWVSV